MLDFLWWRERGRTRHGLANSPTQLSLDSVDLGSFDFASQSASMSECEKVAQSYWKGIVFQRLAKRVHLSAHAERQC